MGRGDAGGLTDISAVLVLAQIGGGIPASPFATGMQPGGSSALALISAMITPAILILAAGSLVASTLTRLARIVDRARLLIDQIATLQAQGNGAAITTRLRWLRVYSRRSSLAERALTLYYVAIGLFVAGSLAITLDNLTRNSVPWLSLALVVAGAISLFFGTAALVIETNMAAGMLREEIASTCGPLEQPDSLHET